MIGEVNQKLLESVREIYGCSFQIGIVADEHKLDFSYFGEYKLGEICVYDAAKAILKIDEPWHIDNCYFLLLDLDL